MGGITDMMTKIYTFLFAFAASRLFTIFIIWPNEKGELGAIHLSNSERDMNSSMRTYVEELDASYEEN